MWTDLRAGHDPSSTKLQPPGTRVQHLRCLQGGFPDLRMGRWSPLGGGQQGSQEQKAGVMPPAQFSLPRWYLKALVSFALSISFSFIPPGRQIFPAVATARCVIPEHGPSPFWVKAGVSSLISFQQTCLPPLTLLNVGNSTMTRCYGCSCNSEHSAGWLNCSDFPMLALSQKKKKKLKNID